MSDPESNLSALIAKVSELEKQQTTLKKYVVKLKHTLDEQIENFHHRPEIQTVENLQEKLNILNVHLDELLPVNNPIKSTEIEDTLSGEISENPQEYENKLVFDRSGSRGVLIEALSTVESRLIIVCPWLNCNGIDENLLEKFKGCLDRGCLIDIGWGYLGDGSNIGKGWKYNALVDLQELEQSYPDLFRLKLLGTHENFLVCDEKFAFVGSHNLLASGEESLEREVGIMTRDSEIIQGLINRFDNAEFLEETEINRRFAVSVKSLDEVEYLSGVMDENEMEVSDNLIEEDEEELEEFEEEEESQEPMVSAEEFLRRYNEEERDFMGINLAGVDLSGKSFNDAKLNLSNANFNGANLSGASFQSVNLTGAKFRDADLSKSNLSLANLSEAKFINCRNLSQATLSSANLNRAKFRDVDLSKSKLNSANLSEAKFINTDLCEADLTSANLSQAKLINTDLSKAKMYLTNLEKVKFRNVNFRDNELLQEANFTEADLRGINFTNTKLLYIPNIGSSMRLNKPNFSGANLRKASFNGLYLRSANFTNADLSQADLSKANLLNANFEGANLQMTKMNQALCSEATVFPEGFNSTKLGVYFLAPNASLRGVNLSGTDLRGVNLSGADLREANLDGAILDKTDLRYANLSGATLKDAHLREAKLITTDLTKADLRNADLQGVKLRGAELVSVDLRATRLYGADLSGANL